MKRKANGSSRSFCSQPAKWRRKEDPSRKSAGYELVSTNVYIPEKLRVDVIDGGAS